MSEQKWQWTEHPDFTGQVLEGDEIIICIEWDEFSCPGLFVHPEHKEKITSAPELAAEVEALREVLAGVMEVLEWVAFNDDDFDLNKSPAYVRAKAALGGKKDE